MTKLSCNHFINTEAAFQSFPVVWPNMAKRLKANCCVSVLYALLFELVEIISQDLIQWSTSKKPSKRQKPRAHYSAPWPLHCNYKISIDLPPPPNGREMPQSELHSSFSEWQPRQQWCPVRIFMWEVTRVSSSGLNRCGISLGLASTSCCTWVRQKLGADSGSPRNSYSFTNFAEVTGSRQNLCRPAIPRGSGL